LPAGAFDPVLIEEGVVVRVLVVSEDVKERLRAVSALALHVGAEVVECSAAEEARRMLLVDREVFDVLVLDGDMRPRGGFAVLYDLRQRAGIDDLPSPPALVMAGREQDRWLAGWAGANEVLLKPVDPFELARRVEALVGQVAPPHGAAGSTEAQVAAATRGHQAPSTIPDLGGSGLGDARQI
jgi:DNA-binding response OmpR family regulator